MLDRHTSLALALSLLAAAPAWSSLHQASGQASTPAKPQADAACDSSCGDGSVESCRCLFQPTFEGACKDADAIFVGEVTSAERAGGDRWRYTLRVTCAWKGELGTAVAESGAHGCPALLEKGKSYLVYASWHGDRKVFEIGSCTRTAALDHAAEDLKRLGEPQRRPASSRKQ